MVYNPELYWEKRLAKSYDLQAVGFDSFGKSYNRWIYRMSAKSLERAIESKLVSPRDKSILEVGCGTGFYINIWQKHGVKSLVGLDISQTSIKELTLKYPAYQFHQADIGSPNLDAIGHYDIVTAFAVLFHITDDERFNQAISNISNLCAKGGMILITDIFPHRKDYVLTHQKSRTLDKYLGVLSANGLQVTNRIPVHYLLNAPLDMPTEFGQKAALLWWKYAVGGIELTTRCLGPLFYGLDSILTKVCKESPTTEMMICKKM